MTAATAPAARTAPRAVERRGVTFRGVLASEWTKLTSLRSTWWSAAVTVVVSTVITYLSAEASSVNPTYYPLENLTSGLVLGQLGPVVLGVLVGAGEYRTGAFRSTFTTVPRRLPVLAAQAVVTAVFAGVLAVVVTAASVLALVPSAQRRDVPLDLGADGTPRVMAGMVVLLVGLALIGLGVGVLVRRTAAAMVAAIGLVLVLPIALMMIPTSGDPMAPYDPDAVTVPGTLMTFLPSGGGQIIMLPSGYDGLDGGPDVGALGGVAVLLAWGVVPLAVAGARLRSRDVR